MGNLSFPIGRIFGIQLRVHVTFFLIVILFALASSVEGGPGLLSGMVWLIIIFSCVLVHELAHSLVARRRGATVKGIVLLPIGGVSQLENLPENPPDEFAIAIVGPLASFGLAAISAVVAYALRVPLWPIDLYTGAFIERAAWFNLIVGAFNLLPAFPMDGGRVLRSLIERKTSLEVATHRAAQIGRVLAIAMVVVGFLFNIWLVIIGIFIFFGASSEEAATIVHARIKEILVKDAMLLDPVTFDESTAVGYLADASRHTAQRDFPVLSAGHYLGMVGVETIARSHPQALVGEIADRAAPVLGPEDHLETAATETLASSGRPAAAVVENGQVVGLLTIDDVTRFIRAATAPPPPTPPPPTPPPPPMRGTA